jgi:hypothetical protein
MGDSMRIPSCRFRKILYPLPLLVATGLAVMMPAVPAEPDRYIVIKGTTDTVDEKGVYKPVSNVKIVPFREAGPILPKAKYSKDGKFDFQMAVGRPFRILVVMEDKSLVPDITHVLAGKDAQSLSFILTTPKQYQAAAQNNERMIPLRLKLELIARELPDKMPDERELIDKMRTGLAALKVPVFPTSWVTE